jgi:hypothetical protein
VDVELKKEAAIAAGWRFSAINGAVDNRYGCFCPAETKPKIIEALTQHIDAVTQGRKK